MSAANYYFGAIMSDEIQYIAGLIRWRTNVFDKN